VNSVNSVNPVTKCLTDIYPTGPLIATPEKHSSRPKLLRTYLVGYGAELLGFKI
jgi:hypothetical protein